MTPAPGGDNGPKVLPKLDDVQRASQEQFARQSQHYGAGHVLANLDDLRAALAQLKLPPGGEVLDVAAGAGHTALFFAGLGYRVTASDIAQPMLDRAQEAAAQRGLSLQTRLHTAEALPYPPETFDLVACRVAAHHFSSPAAFVRETARVLRKSGSLLLIDGTVEDGQHEAEEWAHAVETLRDPSHRRFVTPQAWREFCREAGLELVHLDLTPFKQPDLNWYFDAAGTSSENRTRVLELIAHAPHSARQLFRLGEEDGRIVWWWQRLTLIARKP